MLQDRDAQGQKVQKRTRHGIFNEISSLQIACVNYWTVIKMIDNFENECRIADSIIKRCMENLNTESDVEKALRSPGRLSL